MLKSALGKDISRVILYGIGLGSVSALVYTAGPLIAFEGPDGFTGPCEMIVAAGTR